MGAGLGCQASLQFDSAQLLMKSAHSSLLSGGSGKPNPFWEFELTTCIESIVLCVRPSPSGFVSYSTECAKLYAASKRSSGDIEQGGWGVQLTQ